ncbi:unnamed protein product [Calicophoron daubneyi]|uniref:Uncharacterized protein n=1 Tax=Calicophoron daubneyi TaxID=300641 RepID=A0AAV2T613_CALDB
MSEIRRREVVGDDTTTMLENVNENSVGFETNLLRHFINPFRISWILIRLGHEPLAPVRFQSPLALVGWTRPTYVYPNIFHYVYNTFRTLGFWKFVSTGVFAAGCVDFTSEIFHRAFRRRVTVWRTWAKTAPGSLPDLDDRQVDSRGIPPSALEAERRMEESEPFLFANMLTEAVSLKTWEVIMTHPFYVVMVRQVASLIGGETQYGWFPMAVRSVYRESGIRGFFQGIVPRLLGELMTTVVYYLACRIIRRTVFGVKRRRPLTMCVVQMLIYFGLRSYVYTYELTGCIMTVRGSKLLAATEANSFSGWRECKRYLSQSGQNSRGWLPFLRSHVQTKDLPD